MRAVSWISRFPRSIRDALLAAGLAESITGFPTQAGLLSGFAVKKTFSHALWLMRLSYLRYALKTASDPRGMLEQESEELHLSPEFKSLLERFVPKAAHAICDGATLSRINRFLRRSGWNGTISTEDLKGKLDRKEHQARRDACT